MNDGIALAIAIAVVYVLVWAVDLIAGEVLYAIGRATGQIPECTPGNCYCPDTCEHLDGGQEDGR